MLLKRLLKTQMKKDLARGKMVFIGGPRQVGKTTLSLSFLDQPDINNPHYLNWDNSKHRQISLDMDFPNYEPYLIFDEIHKYPKWSSYLKGVYDVYKNRYKIIVTGSARLDHYTKGGDSLLGRYHYYRLHPISWQESKELDLNISLEQLIKYGGFPEPLIMTDVYEHKRWQNERLRRVVRDDLRDLESVKEVSKIDLLIDALPSRICSPLSFNSLAEDLGVSPKSVTRWMDILENLYVVFPVSPYGSPKIRAVKKERKYYFWDWTQTEEDGPRFENFVASQLLMYCHLLQDTKGYKMELRYLRDSNGREVDFVVLQDKKPLFGVECKIKFQNISKSVLYFQPRTPIPKFYQVHLSGKEDQGNELIHGRRCSFEKFSQIELLNKSPN